MKLHKSLTILIAIIILTSTITLTCVQAKRYRPQTTYKDFTLTATGTAYDRQQKQTVQVTINLNGKANTCGNTWKIKIKGGSITIQGQQQLFAYKGTATLIPKCRYINLHIFTQSQYGYRKTVWNLKGRAHQTSYNQFEAYLKANRAYLPLRHYPKLVNLRLESTITLS